MEHIRFPHRSDRSKNAPEKWLHAVAATVRDEQRIRVRDPSSSSSAGPYGESEMQEFFNHKRRPCLGYSQRLKMKPDYGAAQGPKAKQP
jgi:hypothetical protein